MKYVIIDKLLEIIIERKIFKKFLFTLTAITITLSSFSINVYATEFEGKVNIGDFELYTKIAGDGNVSVVFDSGYGDGINTLSEDPTKGWSDIQSEISKYATTVTYDRAGLGKSDDTTNREPLNDKDKQALLNSDFELCSYDSSIFDKGHGKTAIDKARNLHNLLKAKNIKAPYILVVHSMGIFDAVEFTKLYSNEVAGIIAVSPSGKNYGQDMWDFVCSNYPQDKEAFINSFTKADGTFDEILQSEQQAYKAGDVLRNVPFTCLSENKNVLGTTYQPIKDKQIEQWINLSNLSKKILVPDSGHYIYIDKPEYVKEAIKDMIINTEHVN